MSDADTIRSGRARGRPPVAPVYRCKPSRVSWERLAQLLIEAGELDARSERHSGRPAREQVPALRIGGLRGQGAERGAILLDIKALDGPLSVVVSVRGRFDPDDARLSIGWEYQPEVGSPELRRLDIALLATKTGAGGYRFDACCPDCGQRRQALYWAVHTWSCRFCLGLMGEVHRLGRKYELEKTARAARQRLGLRPELLSPIVVKSAARVPIAEKLWEAEMQLVSGAAHHRMKP